MSKYFKPFEFESESTATSVIIEKEFLLLEFDDTIFYPGGGGQPCDTGFIENDSFLAEVVNVFKNENKIVHKVKVSKGKIEPNDIVKLKINKDRRIRLIKMHTGEHILFKSLEKIFGEVNLVKIDLDEYESSLFIDTKKLTWERLFEAEKLTNQIIKENKSIIEKKYSKDDAIKLGKLRIKPERIKSEIVRVVEVKDFDFSACTGIHVENTGFIENLLITKFNVAKGHWEIKFKTDVKNDIFELAKLSRLVAKELSTETSDLIASIKKLKEEAENYKNKFRNLSTKFLDYNKLEKINNITLIWNKLEDIEKKQLVDKSNQLAVNKTVVCFINENSENTVVLIHASKDLNLDVPKLLSKLLIKFDGKGGGKDSFAMGSAKIIDTQLFINELKKTLLLI